MMTYGDGIANININDLIDFHLKIKILQQLLLFIQ